MAVRLQIMVEPGKTIYISCGRFTDEEKELGKRVCELVTKSTPFEGYFAQNQTTLKTLSEKVLRRLYESVGLIAIMHHRGKIEGHNVIRASVWIGQEIAMATLMEQVLGRPVHVALFVQDSDRSIFLEQNFEQRGEQGHFRWEIPYQCLVRIAEKPEKPDAGAHANAAPVAMRPAAAPESTVIPASEGERGAAALSAAASVAGPTGILPLNQRPKTA